MVLENPEIFYKHFPYKYWLFKAEMLYNMIEDDASDFHDKDGNLQALGGSVNEFQQMLKYELHFTYYHQAEALFELIFALEKVMGDSKYIWLEMSQVKSGDMSRFRKKINRLANESDELRDKKVNLTDGREITFYEWLLYDAFAPENNITEDSVNLPAQKADEVIQFAAKDLANKKEYNAFKHGMRILHLFDSFKIHDTEKEKFELNFDLKNSFTYVDYPKDKQPKGKKAGDVPAITKGYSPKQDLMKIKLITVLMSAIIEVRKMRFFGTGKSFEFADFDIQRKLDELKPHTEHVTYTLHAEPDNDE
jgi:hypothetical protein